MRRCTIAGGISLVLVLTTLFLMEVLDSGPVRVLGFIFLQYPLMLAGLLTRNQVATHVLGIGLAWLLWAGIAHAALWTADALRHGLRGLRDRVI